MFITFVVCPGNEKRGDEITQYPRTNVWQDVEHNDKYRTDNYYLQLTSKYFCDWPTNAAYNSKRQWSYKDGVGQFVNQAPAKKKQQLGNARYATVLCLCL
jgi:hypothetical protein